MHHIAKFCQNPSIRVIAIFRFFCMVAAAILDFRNCQILLAEGVLSFQMHHCAKFSQSPSVYCGVIAIFQDGGRVPSWICLGHIWTTHEWYLAVFITVQNLVATGVVVSTI